jgi:hypothetical protein
MPSRLLAAALLCAAIFAALLGAGAMAQDPAPTADPAYVAAESGQTTIAAADAGAAGTESVAAGAAETPVEAAATSTAAEAGATTATADAAAAPAQADATTTEAGAGEATAADAQADATSAADAEATTTAADAGDAAPVDAGDATGTDAGAATDETTDPAQPDAGTAEATAATPPAATTTTDPAAATPAGATAAAPTTATPATPATSTPATSPTTAPAPSKPEVVGVTVKRSTRTSAPNTASGVGGCTGTGRLIGVVTSSGSTAASGCARVQKTETPDAIAPGDTAATPVAAEPTAPLQRADGTPTPANPTYTPALPGPAAIGVPNFFIDKFRIPPFLLPIYQAAGIQYGVRWEVLAAINEIETDYGRNLNISSAGALGWMQFMPATWQQFGVDANRDGLKDPFNPVDAIFAAARYLNAAGAKDDLRRAIFAYNHADWYVDSVLMRARIIGGLPDDLVGSLTGLTQGRFPVAGNATYAQELTQAERRTVKGHNVAYVVESDERRRGIRIYGRGRMPVVAANDGRIVRIGESARLGRYVVLQDAYGNLYTYARLGEIARTYPALRENRQSRRQIRRELGLLGETTTPRTPASETTKADALRTRERESRRPAVRRQPRTAAPEPAATMSAAAADAAKQRLFANPTRPNAQTAGGDEQLALIAADPIVGRRPQGRPQGLRPPAR